MELAWLGYYDKQNMKNSECGVNFRVGSRLNLSTSAGLFARGVRKEYGKLTRTMSLVNL